MPLEFQLTVFDGSITGSTAVTCTVALDEVLGDADNLVFQVYVGRSSGTSPTITGVFYHSNDGQRYIQHTALFTNLSLTTPPVTALYAVLGSSMPIGRYGRVTLQLGGTSPTAWLRLQVAARNGLLPLA